MKNEWRLPSRSIGVLVLALALAVPIAADTGRPAAAAARLCFDSPPTTTAQFQQLADARNTTWAVGDLTSIIDLPDGRRLFFFGDSGYYDLNGDGSRGPLAGFSSTSAWLQTGGCFTLLNTDGAYGRSWLEPPEQDGSAYWPGGATVVGNRLHVFLTRVFLEPPWGRAVGSAVATFELPSLELGRIANVPFHPERVLGSGAVYDNGYLYSYGSQLPGCVFCFAGDVFIGRVPEDLVSVPSAWEFYANGGWTTTHAAATPVLARAASQTHVQPWRNGFLLVTKSFSIVGPDVRAWWAPTPVGPWNDLGTIYKVPAPVSHVPGHSLVDPYTYMVSVSTSTTVENGGVLLAYNVNSLHEPDVQRDGRLYGPRFVSVQLPAPPAAAERSNPAPAVSAWEPIVAVDSIGRVHAAGGNTSTSASYTRSAVGVARTPTGKGNWAVARRRRRVLGRRRAVLRLDGGHAAQPACRRHRGDADRSWLLAGRRRRWRVLLRRRAVLRVDGFAETQPADSRHDAHRHRPGLLACREGRRRVRVRRRKVLRLDGRQTSSVAGRRHRGDAVGSRLLHGHDGRRDVRVRRRALLRELAVPARGSHHRALTGAGRLPPGRCGRERAAFRRIRGAAKVPTDAYTKIVGVA